MIDLKNQLLMLLMIKAYDVSFYTLLFLISGFYLKDYGFSIYTNLSGSKEFKETFKQSFRETMETIDSNEPNITDPYPFKKSDDSTISSISIEIFLHKQNDTLAHSLLDYVTNKPNIQSISYSKNKFMLNHKNPILIETIDDISRWYWSTNPDDINATLTLDVYNYYNNL